MSTTKPKLTVKQKQEANERSFRVLLDSIRDLKQRFPEKDYFNFVEILENCKAAFLKERVELNEDSVNNVVGVLLTARYQKQSPELPLLTRIRAERANTAGGSYRYNINLDVYNSIYGSETK